MRPALSKASAMLALLALAALVLLAETAHQPAQQQQQPAEAVVGALQAASSDGHQSDESYQRVYEAFTKLLQNVSNQSLGNARRLVTRLNQLVGGQPQPQPQQQVEPVAPAQPTSQPAPAPAPVPVTNKEQQQQQSSSSSSSSSANDDQRTEQILNRLDKVNKDTDQNTLRQLNDDLNKLVGTLSDSYLRNIRRVIERINKTLGGPNGQPAVSVGGASAMHQSGDRLEDQHVKQPGFPGWDEFIVAVDRMQKSLAHFVRSSTRLITSGRR